MDEFADTLPRPDLGWEYLRRQMRESRDNWKVGVAFFWLSLVVYLGTVFVAVLMAAWICWLGWKGNGLVALILLAVVFLAAIVGVGASMLLCLVSAFYSPRGIILYLVEFVTALFLLFFLLFPFG